jgi:hypothetical protein
MDSDRSWTRFSKVCGLERTPPSSDATDYGAACRRILCRVVCTLGISQQYSFENRFTGRG